MVEGREKTWLGGDLSATDAAVKVRNRNDMLHLGRMSLPGRVISWSPMSELQVKSSHVPIRILVVDDDTAVRHAIGGLLREEGYLPTLVDSAEAALELARTDEYALVITDMKMPGKGGAWLRDRLLEAHPETAIIMLTASGAAEDAVESLHQGATDYLLKPPKVTDLVRSIERALSTRRLEQARQRYRASLERRVRDRTGELQQALRNLETTYSTTLWALVAALDARERELSNHSQRVVRYTLAIARRLGLPDASLPDIGRGALLHDIGKIGITDAVLLKPGRLTAEEWVVMRTHPQIGYDILKAIPFLGSPADIVLSHQERFDGSGYPRGLAGEAVPLGARIFAIADTYDAMTSDRPYRKRQPAEAARAEMARCSGTQFDPICVAAFLTITDLELEELSRPTPEQPI
jgi:response regulator RpfG family c-di-GMP phosphodiesterase